MRFNSPQKKAEEPSIDDTRKIKKFAWYKRIGDMIIVMESYHILQTYSGFPMTRIGWKTTGYELIPSKQDY